MNDTSPNIKEIKIKNELITYIIKTMSDEFYCGKSINFDRRLKEHLKEYKPHWFGYKNRKEIKNIIKINGDFENKIKSFGVEIFYDIIINNRG